LAYFGKRGLKFNTNFYKVFKIEKKKHWEILIRGANKAVKDLNSTPSLRTKLGGKGQVWLGKQPIFGLYKEGFFGPVKVYAQRVFCFDYY
jgi:hypothetical protein